MGKNDKEEFPNRHLKGIKKPFFVSKEWLFVNPRF